MITHKAVQNTEYNKIITTAELHEAPKRMMKVCVSGDGDGGVGVMEALMLVCEPRIKSDHNSSSEEQRETPSLIAATFRLKAHSRTNLTPALKAAILRTILVILNVYLFIIPLCF